MSAWIWEIDGWIVLVGMLSACSCALLGNYLVLRKMSLMGDAISHAVLPGLALAFLISNSRSTAPMFAGAVIVGVITAVLIEAVRRYGRVEHGAAMGVVFSVLFALGLILIRQAADHIDLDPGCVLYGNITQIPLDAIDALIPAPVINLLIVFVLNVLFVLLFYKELKISSFDPALASAVGINATLMHYLLMVMVAVTTVANFEAVGSILVIAMLIVPGATATMLTDRLGIMIMLSQIVAVISALAGHALAIWGPGWVGLNPTISVNTAAMMAVCAGVLLVLALLCSPQHGLISKLYHQASLSMQIMREDVLGLLYRWQELQSNEGTAMTRSELLALLGNSWSLRMAIASLCRQQQLKATEGNRYELTPSGLVAASQLVRSHRLWELYLAKHFDLPLDHLHGPAERVEHYISPDMRDALGNTLTDPTHDPHGKSIPETESPHTSAQDEAQ